MNIENLDYSATQKSLSGKYFCRQSLQIFFQIKIQCIFLTRLVMCQFKLIRIKFITDIIKQSHIIYIKRDSEEEVIR